MNEPRIPSLLPHHRLRAYGTALSLLRATREAQIRDRVLRDQARDDTSSSTELPQASASTRPRNAVAIRAIVGREYLLDLLDTLYRAGMRHVALNLKYGKRPTADVLEEIGSEVLPRLGVRATR